MTWEILEGDAATVLATLPAESVHCVVTSPPYWGLRDYGTAATIWGARRLFTALIGSPDAFHEDACRHEWGDDVPGSNRGGSGTPTDKNNRGERYGRDAGRGAFCYKCGAWRGSLGLEPTPELYVEHMVEVFREVKRVLRKDGTCWVNMGDGYAASSAGAAYGWTNGHTSARDQATIDAYATRPAGLPAKNLIGMPWRLAFALQADGWYLRSDVIWSKLNPMPESVTDRPTKAHEYVFLLTKSARYFYDADAVREPQLHWREGSNVPEARDQSGVRRWNPLEMHYNPAGRNLRDVWHIPTEPFPDAHFATFPKKLVEPCIKAGTSERGCCPECGAPWERVVEATKYEPPVALNGERFVDESRGDKTRKLDGKSAEWQEASASRRTTGWEPSCSCVVQSEWDKEQIAPPPPKPCTVLDPFAGSGTTGVVAQHLGRDFIGIELSPEYAEMARKRIGNWRREYVPPAPKVIDGQLGFEVGV